MTKKIIFCNCGGERIDDDRLSFIENELQQLQAEIIKLTDLCGLVAQNKNIVKSLFSGMDDYLLIGCHHRTMKLLLEQVDNKLSMDKIKFINSIDLGNDQIINEAKAFCTNTDQVQTFGQIAASGDWPSWYPVIDYDRCSDCGQCADFCLFGVYEKDKTHVRVVNPQECKNNCPACARICPHTAIIFPKYKLGGAIGGSDQIDELTEQERQTTDIQEILGGDLYNSLEQRKLKRKSIILEEAMRKANEERENALKDIN